MKVVWILFFLITFFPGYKNPINDSPAGLMVEFIREPDRVFISDPEPEFSWIVPDNAINQTSYQILVSSSKELLLKDIGDLWNGIKTTGSGSVDVEYSGNRLSDNSRYFWKVRIWDRKGKPSSWSEIQSFRTGILKDYGTVGNMFVETLIKPEKIVKTGEKSYFIDFGKDAFGKLELQLNPASKDTIIVHLGEKTEGLKGIDRNPPGTIRYHRILLPVEPGKTIYVPAITKDLRNTGPAAVHLPDSVGVITPFRYCELENCNFDINPENISQKALWHYFRDENSAFISSDSVLNKVWNISKYTIKATSFAGIYIDGDRERIPYEADAYINQLGHYYTDREYSLARRTNEYFIDHPTWPTEWILQTVLMFYNDYMYTGNIESVNHFYTELKYKTLLDLARPDGLISSKNVNDEIMTRLGFLNAKDRIKDIVDWPPSQKDTGWQLATPEGERDGYDMTEVNTVVNAFHYRSLVLFSELAGYLGRKYDSLRFRNQALKVRKAINEKLFNRNRGIYIDGEFSGHSSLHANMMALAFDLVPEEYKRTVTDFVKSRGMACSVYGAQFLLEGLYKAGEQDYALSLMTATHDRSWYNMIRSGSTMTMEAWDIKFKPNSDWNHAWGAAPANIIPAYMWGIKPLMPGYSKAVIRPQLGRLTYSQVSVPTIRGNIIAEFRSSGKSKEYLIIIPANMECDFILNGVNNLTEKLHTGTNKIVL
ncbi:MAG TPA: alpha-L-rhamnosidase [Bacteroidales bacterium]|nr:alpha-L-rhamnosidase [Bacteroidales bacterium]HBZ22087.1 alpha-L-rhamnosidase [Bacteroidales bacterium]